jgi:hypothetical protein
MSRDAAAQGLCASSAAESGGGNPVCHRQLRGPSAVHRYVRDVVLIRLIARLHQSRPSSCPVRHERIDETPVVVKPALRSPNRFHEHRRRKSGDGAERAQHIIGSYCRANLPYDRY